ncbi:MAG: CoA-acylating methylmalonate-semialdehyde dehydrogenase [Peptococcaceae bacterium]|nr:CoA-acylating methylmalonate-semialdehyde dehydrogenase [Peptococcaceae bacterium]
MQSGTPVLKNYIDGEWVPSKTKEFLEIRNPATDEVISLYPLSLPEEVDAAVEAAKKAFWGWRTTPIPRRVKLMYKLRYKMEERAKELAKVITTEHGKTFEESLQEMGRCLEYVEDACTVTETMRGSYTEDIAGGVDEYYIREPLGVFAILPPFNFPAMIASYFVWAVACGNTVVVKPSKYCPNTMIEIARLVEECGFPKGVVNVVNGSGSEAGNRLITHPDVAGVTFVGSSSAGLKIYQAACAHGKRAQCQGGAKNHLVVMEDAQLDGGVIRNIINSCFGHVGERCFAGSNVLVVESIYEEFKEKFLEAARKLKLGYGFDPGVTLGPVVDREHLNGILKEIENGVREGAKLLMDGRNARVEGYPNGCFLGPTIFEAEPGMRIFEEEVFGPVRCLKKVKDLGEAISIIDRNKYGHTAVIYTETGKYAREFIRRVNTGQVGVNIGTPAPIAFYPVGGRKISGFGSTRGRAADAVDFYTDKKVVVCQWLKSIDLSKDDSFVW